MSEYIEGAIVEKNVSREHLDNLYISLRDASNELRISAILPLNKIIFNSDNKNLPYQLEGVLKQASEAISHTLQIWLQLEQSEDVTSTRFMDERLKLGFIFAEIKDHLIYALYQKETQAKKIFRTQSFEGCLGADTDLCNDILLKNLHILNTRLSTQIPDTGLAGFASFLDNPTYTFPNGENLYLPQVAYSTSRYVALEEKIHSSKSISEKLASAEACVWTATIREPFLKTRHKNSEPLVRNTKERWFKLCDEVLYGLGEGLRRTYGKIIPSLAELNESLELGVIEKPPQENLRLAIVIPVFNEFRNGHIIRTLEAFCKQRGISMDNFELILLVNRVDTVQIDSEEFEDNKNTIKFLDSSTNPDEELETSINNSYRQQVIKLARRKGLIVHTIDLNTSPVRALTQDRKSNIPIGRIRQYGLREAIRRFAHTSQGEFGIVANCDADTIPAPDYVKEILKAFDVNPKDSKKVLIANLDLFAPHISTESISTHFNYKFELLNRQLKPIIFGAKSTTVGTPSIIGQVGAYEAVGGFRQFSSNEDYTLYEDFLNNDTINLQNAQEVRLYTADRLTEMGSKGFDSVELRDRYQDKHPSPQKELVSKMIANLVSSPEKINNPELCESEAEKICNSLKLPYVHGVLTNAISSLRNSWGNDLDPALIGSTYGETFRIEPVSTEQLVRVWEMIIHSQLSPQESDSLNYFIKKSLRNESIRLQFHQQLIDVIIKKIEQAEKPLTPEDFSDTPKVKEWLEQNNWILSSLKSYMSEQDKPQNFKDHLKQKFPEWLGSTTKETGLRYTCARFQGLIQFMQYAASNPEIFTSIARFLKQTKRTTRSS